jgi:hypothetical protein
MGQLESLREINIAEPNNKRKNKKKKFMPLLFSLMGILVNPEILRHYMLELFGSFIVLC